jgi:hypothetical protein
VGLARNETVGRGFVRPRSALRLRIAAGGKTAIASGLIGRSSPTPDEERLLGDAVEFIRFCYRRRRVAWPEIYDDMCAVAARGSFRGWGFTDLARYGISFTIADLPGLATMVERVVDEERSRRGVQGEGDVEAGHLRRLPAGAR